LTVSHSKTEISSGLSLVPPGLTQECWQHSPTSPCHGLISQEDSVDVVDLFSERTSEGNRLLHITQMQGRKRCLYNVRIMQEDSEEEVDLFSERTSEGNGSLHITQKQGRKRSPYSATVLQEDPQVAVNLFSDRTSKCNGLLHITQTQGRKMSPYYVTALQEKYQECHIITNQVQMQFRLTNMCCYPVNDTTTTEQNNDNTVVPTIQNIPEGAAIIPNCTNESITKLQSPPHHCSCNWTELSKAMELNGIVGCAKQIWDNGNFISDNDSSSRCTLHHPILTQI